MKKHRLIQATEVLKNSGVTYTLFMSKDSVNDFRDIDVIVYRKDLERSVRALVKFFGHTNLKLFNFVKNAYIWQLYFYDDETEELLQIDLMPEISFRGITYLDAHVIFDSAESHDGVFYVNEELHLAANIYRDYLQLVTLSKKVQARLLAIEEGQDVPRVFQGALGQQFDDVRISPPYSRTVVFSKLLVTRLLHTPLSTVMGLCRHFYLRLKRNISYPGMFVVFLGPDGVGKTSAIENVLEKIGLMAKERRYLVPGFLSRYRASSTGGGLPELDPHRRDERGLLFSLVKQLVWITEYVGGYLFVLSKPLYMGNLIVFDRYYSDSLVDKRRYRYGGPDWYLRLCYRLIPSPDITIVMHTTPEIVQSRKQEVSFEESKAQLEAYASLSRRIKNTYIIDAGNPLDIVAKDISNLLLFILNERAIKRLGNIVKCSDTSGHEVRP